MYASSQLSLSLHLLRFSLVFVVSGATSPYAVAISRFREQPVGGDSETVADLTFLPSMDAAGEESTQWLLRRLLREWIHSENRLPQAERRRRKLVSMLLQRDAKELDMRGKEYEDGSRSDRNVERR